MCMRSGGGGKDYKMGNSQLSPHQDRIKLTMQSPPPPQKKEEIKRWKLFVAPSPRGGGGGGVLAPSLGTHCEMDPKSGGGESRDRRAVTAPYP